MRLWREILLVSGAWLLVGCGQWEEREWVPPGEVLAFPGAEGFGAYTKGGRGGSVQIVTNLSDHGAGSLRRAVGVKGARTVVFEVGGTIHLQAPLVIREPFLTVAGQSAPGGGICLAGAGIEIQASQVILRHLRVRPGDTFKAPYDGITVVRQGDVMIDHCSASWAIDECLSAYLCRNLTIQWCVVSEGLYRSHHPKGTHSMGGLWGGPTASFHHNLFAHHDLRMPRFAGRGTSDFRNNVAYNWGHRSAYGGNGGRVNFVANYFKPGPATVESARRMLIDGSSGESGRFYIEGNMLAGDPEVTADNWLGYTERQGEQEEMWVEVPFAAPEVVIASAEDAYRAVLAGVGAFPRDSVDARVVREVETGSAEFGGSYKKGGNRGIIDSQEVVGGWPELAAGEAPADRDRDGMADTWELEVGLDPSNPEDQKEDRDGDGWTNLEEYLNGLVAEPIEPAPALEAAGVDS